MPPARPSQYIGGRRRRRDVASLVLLVATASPAATRAFSALGPGRRAASSVAASRRTDAEFDADDDDGNAGVGVGARRPPRRSAAPPGAASLALALALGLAAAPLLAPPHAAFAYEDSDYASETVTTAVAQLKSNAGSEAGSFKIMEEVVKIVTEGKGVGGSVTFDGVKLDGAVITDEDTTIYNPGLTLLTASEKERLVDSLVQNRKAGLSTGHWSENNEFAFDFLKQNLDPLHMHEIAGYLGIVPVYGALLYLVAVFVQQNKRDSFPLAYALCALGVFGPAFLLIATGP